MTENTEQKVWIPYPKSDWDYVNSATGSIIDWVKDEGKSNFLNFYVSMESSSKFHWTNVWVLDTDLDIGAYKYKTFIKI